MTRDDGISVAIFAALLGLAMNAGSPAGNVILIWITAIWVILWAWRRFAWHES